MSTPVPAADTPPADPRPAAQPAEVPDVRPDEPPAEGAAASREPASLRATRAALRRLAAMPPRALRLLAGRPVVIDGQTLLPEAQIATRFLDAAPGERIEDLPVPQARAELEAESWLFGATTHIASVRDLDVPGADGPLRARLYDPLPGRRHDGIVLFFHGGGYVLGSLDVSDPMCRFLARCAGMPLLSIDYRLAPEHPYPAAAEDALAAARHVVAHLDEYGAAGARVVVAGESAGGGLAALVAQRVDGIAGQLLVTPWLDLAADGSTGSYWMFGDGYGLTHRLLAWYRAHYLTDLALATQVTASPGRVEDLTGQPPALIVISGFDPLRDEGVEYARRLEAAGVPVDLRVEEGMPHSALNATGVSRRARDVLDDIGAALRRMVAP